MFIIIHSGYKSIFDTAEKERFPSGKEMRFVRKNYFADMNRDDVTDGFILS